MRSVQRRVRCLTASTPRRELTDSTTTGMNALALALGLTAGHRVLTSNQEHLGGRMCWNHLARRDGVIIDEVALPPHVLNDEDRVARLVAALQRELA